MAIEQKLIALNPTNKCALPKVEHHEMNTLTQDQLAAFLAEARRSGVYEMYYTELATGLRRGELLGLKWGDIDFKDNLIRIRRQVARIDGNVVEAPLKTKNAYRCVAITQDVADILKQKKADDNGRSEYVFSSETGGPISPDSVLNMLHRVLDRAGLPRLRFHDLRHTLQPWLCRTAWTSKLSPECLATTPRASRLTLTLTSQRLRRPKPPRRWAGCLRMPQDKTQRKRCRAVRTALHLSFLKKFFSLRSFARNSPAESFPVLSADIRIWVTVWVSAILAKMG